MDGKLLNKVITISAKEERAGQYGSMVKIKDENNLTYTVYQLKKDGTTSTAWEQLQSLPLGSTVQISYVEQPKQTPEGKGYMARTIRTFDKDIGNGVSNAGGYQRPAQEQSSNGEANRGQSGPSRDFDKEAVGKCQFGFLEAYIQSGHTIQEAMLQVAHAKKLAEYVVYGHSEPVAPDIQEAAEQMAQDEDLNVEDITF